MTEPDQADSLTGHALNVPAAALQMHAILNIAPQPQRRR